ncbi:MAG: ATP-binding cassette domain-containing protein [Phycisphaera sp.]|nr:ATP-binding cassette domain-containing protein [Phycisphaera sp.]
MASIRLTNLTKRFGRTTAVDAVDLTIASGELFFLLGPSGCGKTTLMRMIAGLIEPSSGTIHFDDRDVTHQPTAKRNTALVFQGYALWPHMTVAQNVAFGLDVRNVPAQEKSDRVTEVLRTVGLADHADRKPMQLSGGQQQRVALARALVVNPDVLLLDEPLSNLDAKLRLRMRNEIRRICKASGITSVYVTHDQEEALSIADRVAVLRDGRIIQVGTPQELYGNPRSRFVADFLGKANFIPAVVGGLDGDELNLESPAGNLRSRVFGADLPEGGNVTCMVRPESLRLLNGTPDDTLTNIIPCRHIDTIYLGNVAQHTFETDEGLHLYMEELKPRERDWTSEQPEIGFSADDLVVLAD